MMDRVPGQCDVPPAPRRPSPLARRLIFGYQGRQKVLLIIGAVFLVLGLGMSTVFCWGLPVDMAIDLDLQSTEGVLLNAERNLSLKVDDRFPTRVRFQYEGGGIRWEGTADTFRIQPGQSGSIPVEFAGFHPAWGRISGETHGTFGYPALASLLMPFLGAAILASALRSNRREIHAFTHGRPALARVTFRGQDHAIRINGRHPYRIQWEFRTESGVLQQGALSSMHLEDLEAFKNVEQVVILYDPAHPRANTLYVP